jgi:hypothetical protein
MSEILHEFCLIGPRSARNTYPREACANLMNRVARLLGNVEGRINLAPPLLDRLASIIGKPAELLGPTLYRTREVPEF